MELICRVLSEHGISAGHDLGRDQTGRLMRIAGIAGVVRGEHHDNNGASRGAVGARAILI